MDKNVEKVYKFCARRNAITMIASIAFLVLSVAANGIFFIQLCLFLNSIALAMLWLKNVIKLKMMFRKYHSNAETGFQFGTHQSAVAA